MLSWLATTGDSEHLLNWSMALTAMGVLLGGVFGVMSYRSVVKPLERTRQDIERMSSGDLTGRIEASGDR